MDDQFDNTEFTQVKEHANYLKSQHGTRNDINTKMKELYFLDWDDEPRVKRVSDKVKPTKHPDPRVAIKGAARLITATDVEFNVPYDENQDEAEEISEKLEEAANVIWKAAGRVHRKPLHYDLALSALLFDEFCFGITNTKDLIAHVQGSGSANEKRAEQIAARTPFMFDVWYPSNCYPEYDNMGLRSFYRETEMLSGEVIDQFGEKALAVLGPTTGRYKKVTFCDFWDLKWRHVWLVGNKARPLLQEEHDLIALPIVSSLVEGSCLFDTEEERREPWLYTLWKTGLWSRQNLALTVLYTNIFAIGANPLFVETLNQQGEGVKFDDSTIGGKVKVPYGANFAPLHSKGVIDPSISQGLEIAERLSTETTMYRQALGEPLGKNATFSMVALLSQSGRLPLTNAQRMLSWGIGDGIKIALQQMKKDKRTAKARYADKVIELKAADIPDEFEIEAKVELSLPQDKLQNANIANMITTPPGPGQPPLASMRWARENVLQIGQSEKMDDEIMDEGAFWAHFQMYLQQQQFMQQQGMMQAMNNMQQGQAGPPPTEEGGAAPGGAPPVEGGLPPGMAQGGMGPPQGMRGVIPPEQGGMP